MAKKVKVSYDRLLGAIKRVLTKKSTKGIEPDEIAREVVNDLARGSGNERRRGRKRRKGHGPANPPKIDIPAI